MHTIADFTFTGHTWPQELCHAKFIIGRNAKQLLQLHPRLPWPRLSAKETDSELRLAEVQPPFRCFISDVETNRRSHTDSRDAKVGDKIKHALVLASIRTH